MTSNKVQLTFLLLCEVFPEGVPPWSLTLFVSVSLGAITKYHRPAGLNNIYYSPEKSNGREALSRCQQIRFLARANLLVDGSFVDGRLFAVTPHGRVTASSLVSVLIATLNLSDQGPPFCPHLTWITSLLQIQPLWRLGLQHMNWGEETQFSP